ncbi:thioesterase domain-containing protein [Actinoplanes sp. NPDC049316]|uniref:thioesterase II family protein n=1 Tax=Actinoplanes sp. NPDC049316 TaxID=3154727 RepID=UPI00343C1606
MTVWLPREPSRVAAGRVFCIPQAGYGSGVYAAWPAQRDGVEFLPVELPGRMTRFGEAMPESFALLVRDLAFALAPYLDVPYAFFGHCWSAHVAYEATARIEAVGGPPAARLFVSSQVAPQDGPYGRMLDMTDADLTRELEETVRAQGNTPYPDLVALYLRVLRGDVELARRYVVPEPVRVACPITAIGWSGDTEVGPGLMTGWPACGDTTFTVFDGPHLRFAEAPPELLDTLSRLHVTSP